MSDVTQFLKEEIERTERAYQDLQNHKKKERTTVAGFLRVLKIQYEDREIQKKGDEPVDIRFQGVHFQVIESLDEGRRHDDEIHKRLGNLKWALATKKFEHLRKAVEVPGSFSPPPNCIPEDYFQRIFCCSEKKAKKYGRVDGDIDLLVYINMKGRHLYPIEPWPTPEPLMEHGWRSVSFVDNCYARGLYAKKNAPAFLQAAVEKTHGDPKDGGIFPQELGPEEKCEAETVR